MKTGGYSNNETLKNNIFYGAAQNETFTKHAFNHLLWPLSSPGIPYLVIISSNSWQ